MSRKTTWIGVVAVVLLVAGALTWRFWPDTEPTMHDELAAVAGVLAVKGDDTVVLSADVELASLEATVAEVSAVVQDHDASIIVLIGDTYFRAEREHDNQRATELAWATAGMEELESAQIVTVHDELVDAKLPEGASLLKATNQLLDRFTAEHVKLPDGTLRISIPAATHEGTEVRISGLSLKVARSAQAEVAAATRSSGAELVRAEMSDHRTDLTLEAADLADVSRVRDSVRDEVGNEDSRLTVVVGELRIVDALERTVAESIGLVERVQRTGATVTHVGARLDDISVKAPTAEVVDRVVRLMASPDWTLQPAGRVQLQLHRGDADDGSEISGDSASVLRMGPMFLQLARAGYQATFQLRTNGEGRDVVGVRPYFRDGYPHPDLLDAATAGELIDDLRSGDWPGRMQFVVHGSATVFISFVSTPQGRAGDVEESLNTPQDLQDVAGGLRKFVEEWNASAG